MILGADGHPIRPKQGEASLLPQGETPVAAVEIDDRASGHQISGVYYLEPADLPQGWAGMGWEFTTSEVLVMLAGPVLERARGARLVVRWVEGQHIWTKSMTEVFSRGLGRATPTDDLQRQLQGQVIRYFARRRGPSAQGGEDAVIAFSSGEGAHIQALPSGQILGATAALEVEFLPSGRVWIDVRPTRNAGGPP